jgi:hypothetical protein
LDEEAAVRDGWILHHEGTEARRKPSPQINADQRRCNPAEHTKQLDSRLTKLSRRAATLLSSFFAELSLSLLTSAHASSIVEKLRFKKLRFKKLCFKNQAQTSQPVPLING